MDNTELEDSSQQALDDSESTGAMQAPAKYYAGLGWKVFPLHAPSKLFGCSCFGSERRKGGVLCTDVGKHPRTMNGLTDATTDLGTLAVWFHNHKKRLITASGAECLRSYPGSNIGLVGGKASGLVVVDIDPKSGGRESLAKLRAEGHFPATLEARSGSGGTHLYYRHPEGAVIGSLNGWRPGIDIKATGGYVVAPPSLHYLGGVYTWGSGRLPQLTDLVELPASTWSLLPKFSVYSTKHEPSQVIFGESGKFPALIDVFQRMGLCDLPPTVLDQGSPKERVVVRCPNRDQHSNNSDGSSSTVIFTRDCGVGVWVCKHAHCEKYEGGVWSFLSNENKMYLLKQEIGALSLMKFNQEAI
jgi:hypothetical protein